MEDGMQTVTSGASHLEVTPIAYGTWQFGGDWESVDEQAVAGLVREGLTRHVGVSNYSTDQITEFAAVLPAETVQPPYHLFRRDIEADLLPYARAHHISRMAQEFGDRPQAAAERMRWVRQLAAAAAAPATCEPGPGAAWPIPGARRPPGHDSASGVSARVAGSPATTAGQHNQHGRNETQ
jgi:hypothetical protein